jgi:hypothetical protein
LKKKISGLAISGLEKKLAMPTSGFYHPLFHIIDVSAVGDIRKFSRKLREKAK